MEDYMTDSERVDWLRARVKEYAPWAIAGLAIAFAAVAGRHQFEVWQSNKASAAGQRYSAALDALSHGNRDGAARIATELKSISAKQPYADLLDLALARFDVDANKLDDAEHRLDELARGARDEDLRVVARLRLARVQRAAGKLDAALATLAAVPAAAGGAAVEDVRGDVLADKGDASGARKAWTAALDAKQPGGVNRELVELKLAALGPAPAAAAAPGGGHP